MRYVISILIIVLFQPPKVITLKDYYRGEGVIFDENAVYPFKEIDYYKSYVPSLEDIKRGEDFLFDNYYLYFSLIRQPFLCLVSYDWKIKQSKTLSRYEKINLYFSRNSGILL